MDPSEYRNYILGFIFYKYLSEKFVNAADLELKNDNKKYLELDENDDLKKELDNKRTWKIKLWNKFWRSI